MKELGIDHSIHCTRHTFITRMITCEVPDTYVKAIVGHSSNDITKDAYTHIQVSDLYAELNRIDY